MGLQDVEDAIQAVLSAQSNGALSAGMLRQKVVELSANLASNLEGKDAFVFYSGSYLPDISAHDAAVDLASQSSRIALIDQTDMGAFLSDERLRGAIQQETVLAVVQPSVYFSDQFSALRWKVHSHH